MRQAQAIGARQIRAARALLDWSQEDLAAASVLSVATIRKLELGYISPRHSTTRVIRDAIENAGLEFIEPDGIRRRQDDVTIYQGAEGASSFFEDLQRTTSKNGEREIAAVASDVLLGNEALNLGVAFERIIYACGGIKIKFLLVDVSHFPSPVSRLECRSISKQYIDPIPFLVYGDKYAVIVSDKTAQLKIAVIRSGIMAKTSWSHFFSMWDKATPLYMPALCAQAQ